MTWAVALGVGRIAQGIWARAGRIRVRLLVVNLILVLVPVVGLEFAELYERQLLRSLERDMRNQATLLTEMLVSDLDRGAALRDPIHEKIVQQAARSTRTRLRVIEPDFAVTVDSHRHGPPEGQEPAAPSLTRAAVPSGYWLNGSASEGPDVPLSERSELHQAMSGKRATMTRQRLRPPAVLLFLAQPIRYQGKVLGAVYVTRSTQPVLVEMHRIRAGLLVVLGLAFASTAAVTFLLAWTLTRPIERLAHAARKIAGGQRDVELPQGGGGEFTELAHAFSEMKDQLQARHRYIAEFAADVAHEFKSPLTSIRGAAELLDEGAADDPKTRTRFLRNILLDAARLEHLVSRLLELSRIDASDEPLSLVSLDQVVRTAIERCESPERTIEYAATGHLHMVQARPRDLETALLNLLDNALRYSPSDAVVKVEICENASPSQIGIRVIDRGPGIPKEQQAKVFERFFTTNNESGTGLGLSIVASVAAAHGGSVELQSEFGAGAAFTLWVRRAT